LHDCEVSRQGSISVMRCVQVLSATGQSAGEAALLPAATAIHGTKAGATDGNLGSSQQIEDGVRQKVCWRLDHSRCAINAVVPAVPVQPLQDFVHSQCSMLQEKDIASVVAGNGARPLSIAEVPGMTLYPGTLQKQAGRSAAREVCHIVPAAVPRRVRTRIELDASSTASL
jgi:hypothetical protein